MNKQELAELIRDRDDMVAGRVAPVRTTEVVFDATTGLFSRRELDPEACRRKLATEFAKGQRQAVLSNARNISATSPKRRQTAELAAA